MPYSFRQGHVPLLVSIPHNGSFVPLAIRQAMTPCGQASVDTDWFVNRLYDLPEVSQASLLVATHSRYVIDLNRPPDGHSLYPGQTTTGLVPTECFNGQPIYRDQPPSPSEIRERIDTIWEPYHHQLRSELNRLVQQFGKVVLLDAHSIASRVPRLFSGTLPDINLGTNCGLACDAGLTKTITAVLAAQNDFSHVVDGRFVGGYITRNYGQPQKNIHAIQIELSQATYLDESNGHWEPERASRLQAALRQLLTAILNWATTP